VCRNGRFTGAGLAADRLAGALRAGADFLTGAVRFGFAAPRRAAVFFPDDFFFFAGFTWLSRALSRRFRI
jgi:hypothetical protein